jgi:hypothetical protein
MPTRASDLQVDPVGRVMLIGCGAALFGAATGGAVHRRPGTFDPQHEDFSP